MNYIKYLIDLSLCLRRMTRIPLPGDPQEDEGRLSEAGWAMPVIGAFLGGIAAVVYLVVAALGLGPGLAAVVAAAVSIGLTGAGPERALAKAATRIAGRDREDEPAFGEWGTISLVLSLAVRIGVIAAIGEPFAVAGALIGAGAIGYAALMAAVHAAPDASAGGLAADLGRTAIEPVGAAVLIGAVISLIVAPHGWVAAMILAGAATAGVVWLATRREPGVTGTIALAAMPVAEAVALLAIAAAA